MLLLAVQMNGAFGELREAWGGGSLGRGSFSSGRAGLGRVKGGLSGVP